MNIELHQGGEVQDLAAPSTCRRIGAALVDFALLPALACTALVLLRWTLYANYDHPHYAVPPLVPDIVGWATIAFVPLGIELPTTAYFGTSIGKCVFGIKVVGQHTDSRLKWRALFRTLFKWCYFYSGICLPYLLTTSAKYIGPGQFSYDHWFIPEGWNPSLGDIFFTLEFDIAIIIFNIVVLFLILGLHRKDRLGVYDQIVGTRLVRSDC